MNKAPKKYSQISGAVTVSQLLAPLTKNAPMMGPIKLPRPPTAAPTCDPALPPSNPGSCGYSGTTPGGSSSANQWSEIAKQLAILASTATSSRNAGLGEVCERSLGVPGGDTKYLCAEGSVADRRWKAYQAIVSIYNQAGADYALKDGISSPGDLLTGGMLQSDVVGVIAGVPCVSISAASRASTFAR